MKLPFTTKDKIGNPQKGFGFAFIDSDDKKLKIKKHDSTIEFTNDLSDVQLLDLTDYTAFEVCPHKSFIKKGTKIVNSILANAKNVKEYLSSLSNDEERQNAIIDYNIEISMMHEFTIRSEQLPDMIDVIIDWGDGNISKCSSDYIGTDNQIGGILGGSRGDYRYKMQHEYKEEGIYTVKIYGKNYFAIIPNKLHNNITCSIFREDLPVASHLSNFSSFSYGARMLLYVNLFNCGFNNQVLNAANLFYYCLNLKKAVGFNSYTNMKHCGGIFGHCYALKYTDFKFPSFSLLGDYRESFYKCWALSTNIEDHFPTIGFVGNKPISILSAFYECKSLQGTPPANKLWNDKRNSFENTNDCFSLCSDEIRDQVPESWGRNCFR